MKSGNYLRNLIAKGNALIPYITAGDPDMTSTLKILEGLAEGGATAVEIGVPFSDPLADGPIIQESHQRALASGADIGTILNVIKLFKKNHDLPIILFTYLNPLLSFLKQKTLGYIRQKGVDGILFVDAPFGSAKKIYKDAWENGICPIYLISPTTTSKRCLEISRASKGFIYRVSRLGVTGEVGTGELSKFKKNKVPVVVGFGIKNREDVKNVWKVADGAVVGSALIKDVISMPPKKTLKTRACGYMKRLTGEFR